MRDDSSRCVVNGEKVCADQLAKARIEPHARVDEVVHSWLQLECVDATAKCSALETEPALVHANVHDVAVTGSATQHLREEHRDFLVRARVGAAGLSVSAHACPSMRVRGHEE